MVDAVSTRLAASLAISENGKRSFGPQSVAAVSTKFFGVGRLLAFNGRVGNPKIAMGTLSKLWDLNNRLSMRHLNGWVRVLHQISTRVQSILPPQVFDFAGFKARVRFKYEKLVGFCRMCGFFKHVDGKCAGAPPDVLSASGSVPDAVQVPVVNQFTGTLDTVPGGGSSSAVPNLFRIPGMSALEVEAMADKFRTSGSSSRTPSVPPPPPTDSVVHPSIIVVKRQAHEPIITYAKRGKVVTNTPVSTIQFEGDLALKNINGVLVVSPQKKTKRGRPAGSSNKPKLAAPPPRDKIIKAKRARLKSAKALEVTASVEVIDPGQQMEIAGEVGLLDSAVVEGSTNADVGVIPQHE